MNVARAAFAAAAAVGAAWVARAAWGLPVELGAGRRSVARSVASATRAGAAFRNTDPASPIAPGSGFALAIEMVRRGGRGRPPGAVPVVTPIAPASAADLAVTWYGHSSVLIEVDGRRVLTDPVWSERVSPSRTVGPGRLHPVPGALADLPPIDAVVVSHDHYDHLDRRTVTELVRTQKAPFVVPLGIGAHLRRWAVPADRIVELDWDESADVAGLTLTCTEARHFSGRFLTRNPTQWASWVIAGEHRRVFFGGDSGYTARFARVGERYGPFDLTLLPVGAYDHRWADVHMTPEEAVSTHRELEQGDASAGTLVPIHWATFDLAFHAWSEPVDRLVSAAADAGTHIVVPTPGQRVVPERDRSTAIAQPWWSQLL
ncbi:MBL fold metallo-hydrolase [Rhodococcus sp. HNM0569]|uniref:MBL fold metallo-hydrolase n=1 Tax=Rhodococcus sp. HNM0569 TaxID=2716340 RepID=UPI003211E077